MNRSALFRILYDVVFQCRRKFAVESQASDERRLEIVKNQIQIRSPELANLNLNDKIGPVICNMARDFEIYQLYDSHKEEVWEIYRKWTVDTKAPIPSPKISAMTATASM